METNLTLEVAQLLLSLVHAWGLDPDLDRVCEGKLGLLRPLLPVSFGMLSKGDLPPEMVYLEMSTRYFTSRAHWELSTSMTTAHLLAVIALSNTLMAMNCATFVPEQERKRRMHRPGMRSFSGWSLLSTLHCILLPDKLAAQGSKTYKRPLVEQLARRWQDQCLEVRSAAQTLLLAELNRMGSKGRKALVDSWAPFLPFKPDKAAQAGQQNPQTQQQQQQQPQQPQQQQQPPPPPPNQLQEGHAESPPTQHDEGEEEEEEGLDVKTKYIAFSLLQIAWDPLFNFDSTADLTPRRPSSHSEAKRKEATAVVLLGVIGAEFGQDIEAAATKRKASAGGEVPGRKRGSVVEGFGIAGAGNNLARCTSLALMNILLAEPTSRHPAHSAMRRAATDLIGRGFTVWEPYLDVSRVLLGLLEQCCEADKLVPSMTYGLPLTPAADACRTARNSLSLIATARPGAFITTMAREVARYNTLQQNAQTLNVNLSQMVLHRAKPEILRNVELLIDKMQNEMAELLVEVMDIVLHCLDPGHLKVKGLHEIFPAVCRFQQVSHCTQTRRIAVGARTGQLALYELRSSRCQLIPAHGSPITACAFSPDGKFLASYACNENKLCFWQTSTGMFGLGNSQTRCVKTHATAAIADVSRYNPLKLGRLIWMNNKTISLILCDGSEARYNV
ncbi:hypothetical protein B566_EDAN012443 [Ephemera danica]|nr:hypothetical protein B566_EDAN012443 [Ephemera danica]